MRDPCQAQAGTVGSIESQSDSAQQELEGAGRARERRPMPLRDLHSTLGDHVASRLAALCGPLKLDAARVVATTRNLIAPWADVPAHALSAWPSEISDDNTPIEFSVAFARNESALRILFEPQAMTPAIAAFRLAGLAFLDRLESSFAVDLSRFRRVQDLFLPEHMQGRFALWCSAVFDKHEQPSFKAYLNPQAQGTGASQQIVEEALARLGLHAAWTTIREVAMRRGVLDEVKYVALDLEPHRAARINIYVHHHDATAAELDAACRRSQNCRSGDVVAFARALRGSEEPMRARAPLTCHALTSEAPEHITTTAYVPVCAYARDDGAVCARFTRYLEDAGLNTLLYHRIVAAASIRRLEIGVGMQSWIALRPNGDEPRFAVHVATEANRIHEVGTVPAPSAAPVMA